jgi:hypothetical protein
MTTSRRSSRLLGVVLLSGFGGVVLVGVAATLLVLLLGVAQQGNCGGRAGGAAGSIVLAPPGSGQLVGATEYGGPGDPSSGVTGARGDNLLAHPDTYAELGGLTWQTASAMGGLPYMSPLRVTWANHSAIAYKRDFGLGGGPVAGLTRAIDLWWQFAGRIGVPYENGQWSGPVRVERPPDAGSAGALGQTPASASTGGTSSQAATSCSSASAAGLALTPGQRAKLLPSGQAAAPSGSPAAVKAIIAAGNQIVGKPYVYGGAHGLPLSEIAPAYDCSSSVEHLLYGARLLPVTYGGSSSELEGFGDPGTGSWVTLYASASHVFMYVAGLRWDTHNAAGSGDGSSGIGWHPLVRDASGFVARHPGGL